MKKLLIFVAIFFGVILLAAALLPVIFKDDIQRAIDKQLNENLNAQVYYNTDEFSLSLFKRFPDLTLTIGDFGIVGIEDFAEDTLLAVNEFQLTIDIMSVIRGEKIEIVKVLLDQPNINVLVLQDGKANYDIVKDTGETAEEDTTTEESEVNIGIESWEIVNGNILYDDASIRFFTFLGGLNHKGSGDFEQDVFDMVTSTSIDQLSLGYDGVEYISNKRLMADIVMAMDLAAMKFTFKENRVALNNFAMGFDGFVSMPSENIDMDITFGGQDIGLASVLSLIPGVYQEYLEGLKAGGEVSFDGSVKGTFNEESMPAIVANFAIVDGRVDYSESPVPLENIQIHAAFNYPSADLKKTTFKMDTFTMSIQDETITASLFFQDLEDYFWDFKVDGVVDLAKVTAIVPLEGMELKGRIDAALQTSGRMSDLENERYGKLPTNGSVTVAGFYFSSETDLPQGFGIAESRMTFDPKAITLVNFKGNAGKTDLNMKGAITNYLPYALGDSAKLTGSFDFYSALVDANEWMTSTDTAVVEETDTVPMEVVRVPEDLDFVLTSKIDQILYDNLTLSDFGGKVIIRDGAVVMEKVNFNLLDGSFNMDGAYESAMALEQPLYDFDLKIRDLSISSAFKAFTTVQKLVPVAEKMTGKFSTDFHIAGTIGDDMMPIYEEMNGKGLVMIENASVQDVKVIQVISNVSKLGNSDGTVALKDVDVMAEIKGGRLYVEPFDVTIGGRKMTVSGSTGLDGSLDYAMLMNVPTGQVGDALNSAISSFTGGQNFISTSLDLTLGLTGTYDDPKVKIISAKPAGSENKASSLKTALTTQAKERVAAEKEKVVAKVEEVKDSVSTVVEEKKEEAKEVVQEKKEEVKDKAKDAVKGLLKKKD